MKYSDLDAALKTVLPDAVYHLEAAEKLPRYITWQESGTSSLYADNVLTESVLLASVYVYTQFEEDSLLQTVIAALSRAGVAVGDPVPAYDEVLMTMGWIIDCEMV